MKSLAALRDEDVSQPFGETRTSRHHRYSPPKHIHFILYAIFTSYYAIVLISTYYQDIRVKELLILIYFVQENSL